MKIPEKKTSITTAGRLVGTVVSYFVLSSHVRKYHSIIMIVPVVWHLFVIEWFFKVQNHHGFSVDDMDLMNINGKRLATSSFPSFLFYLQVWFNIFSNVHCPMPMRDVVQHYL